LTILKSDSAEDICDNNIETSGSERRAKDPVIAS
jgi:hypothetical protein